MNIFIRLLTKIYIHIYRYSGVFSLQLSVHTYYATLLGIFKAYKYIHSCDHCPQVDTDHLFNDSRDRCVQDIQMDLDIKNLHAAVIFSLDMFDLQTYGECEWNRQLNFCVGFFIPMYIVMLIDKGTPTPRCCQNNVSRASL